VGCLRFVCLKIYSNIFKSTTTSKKITLLSFMSKLTYCIKDDEIEKIYKEKKREIV
jgi:phosphosulfolactate phosphohydrolase-like enzyme